MVLVFVNHDPCRKGNAIHVAVNGNRQNQTCLYYLTWARILLKTG